MLTILHIDNSSFFRKILKSTFEKKGFTCHSAKDVDEAFDILQGNPIDLIVTAMEIKGGGGEYFVESVNTSEYKNIPVIVVTSNDSIEVRKKMFSLGVIDFIPKSREFANHLYNFIVKVTEKDKARREMQNMKIAVLDDSKLELNIIKNILQLNNISKIDFYTDPDELLKSSKKYHIYFIDIILPHISGEQVILHLRKHYRDSVIIAISGIDNYKVVSNILSTGADDYMLKPFNASIFMARLIANVRTYLLLEELEGKNEKLEVISNTDDLTGTYNHKYIHERLVSEIREAAEQKKNLSIILLGIDSFTAINDTYGHQVGDRVIKTVAKIIKDDLSDLDILGRYGGVEFLIILPETNLDEASRLANKIRTQAGKVLIKEHRVSISAGAVEMGRGDSAMDMVRKADSLLFNAKKKGKNRIETSFDWENY